MIENLKIGCTVHKDQVMRILAEDIDADNVLDALDFDVWFVEHGLDGAPMREEPEDENTALSRYNELKNMGRTQRYEGLDRQCRRLCKVARGD